jgi:uncharacterized protein Smg (DUF494 family)
MSRADRRLGAQTLLALLADHLEEFAEGGDLVLGPLGETIERHGFTADDIQSAILALRSMAGIATLEAVVAVDEPPTSRAHRVLSREERESLSPEAWGYLLDLRRRGSLDAGQFERVLDRLTASGVRPVGVEFAREVAAYVALREHEGMHDVGAGDGDISH